uniref:Uncharacterized protein n=1 Tax=Megaselia scalaris TaxID=36166 RepID=T1GL17_MEGSC
FNRDGFYVIEDFLTPEETEELHKTGKTLCIEAPKENRKIFSTTNSESNQNRENYFLESGDKIRYFFEKDAVGQEGELLVDPLHALNKVGHALHTDHPTFNKFTFSNRVKEICWQLGYRRPAVPQKNAVLEFLILETEMLCRKLITSAQKRVFPSSILIFRGTKTKVVPNLHGAETKVVVPEKTLINKFFGKYLLITNTVSSGLLMIAGDVICQEIEFRRGELKKRYDYKRIWQMFLVGSLQGPMHHWFYGWLARIMPEATVKNAVKKILWDQFVMSPACILMFFYPACLLENKPFHEATKEIKDKFLTVYVVSKKLISFKY